VILFALVSSEIEAVIDFYPRGRRPRQLHDCFLDEPDWEGVLPVEVFKLETNSN
jgi:hypothetical protein